MLAPQKEVSFSSSKCGLSSGGFEYLFMCPRNDSGHVLSDNGRSLQDFLKRLTIPLEWSVSPDSFFLHHIITATLAW